MRIAIICDELDHGRQTTGISVFVQELLAGLRQVSTEEEFLLIHADARVQLGDGGRFRDVILPHAGGELMRNLKHLPRLLRELAVEVVHEPRHFPPRLPAGIKGVITIHDLASISHAPPGWQSLVVCLRQWVGLMVLLRHYTCVAAISQWTADEIHRWLGIRRDKIQTILQAITPNFRPASTAAVAALRCKYKLAGSYWLNVGTIGWRKNQTELVRAFEQVASRFPEVTLVISGRPSDAWSQLSAAVAVAKLGGRIRLLTDVPDEEMPALYTAADWLIFPSICEGFGLPLLEAQVCGTPVICSRNSSLREIGGDSIAPIENPPLASAVAAAIVDAQPRREALVAAGFCNAQRFSREKRARAYLQIYRELAIRRRA